MPTIERSRPSISVLLGSMAVALAAIACKPAMGVSRSTSDVVSDSPATTEESITNVQEQGVDEGGIVKSHGDHLVVLRRGRLFSVHLGDDALRPVSYVDVTPHPSHDAWYDEMLIHGDTIVVIGFSYRVRATEIGMFHIDEKGTLSYQDTWFLASNDYYSSRNYASRLVGDQLVFYMPHYLASEHDESMPRLAQWKGSSRRTRKHGDWARLVEHGEIVPPLPETERYVLHSVVTCDLGPDALGCHARGILGGESRWFYVSQKAVYVWTTSHGFSFANGSGALYRLPLGDGPMGAAYVSGNPIDQFSFDETADGHLAVLVTTETVGDGMWGAEGPAGDLGLLHVPIATLERRGERVPATAYRDLPDTKPSPYALQNRFIGDVVIYGGGTGWGTPDPVTEPVSLFVHHHADPDGPTDTIELPHAVDRIEALGRHGLVVGSDGKNLHFTSLRLGAQTNVASRYVAPEASQGELRSHGFFYEPSRDGHGMLGLPMRGWNAPGAEHLWHGSAGVTFLRVDDLRLSLSGELESDPRAGARDACLTSCVDWYGNARPIFYRGRVFALLGYELVEGQVIDGRVHERRRTDLTTMLGGGGLRHAG